MHLLKYQEESALFLSQVHNKKETHAGICGIYAEKAFGAPRERRARDTVS